MSFPETAPERTVRNRCMSTCGTSPPDDAGALIQSVIDESLDAGVAISQVTSVRYFIPFSPSELRYNIRGVAISAPQQNRHIRQRYCNTDI